MVNIIFYGKDGCWFCDQVEEMLLGMKVKHDLVIKKVRIDLDDELYELYRHDIPVVEFKDGTTLHGHVKRKALLKKIEENRE